MGVDGFGVVGRDVDPEGVVDLGVVCVGVVGMGVAAIVEIIKCYNRKYLIQRFIWYLVFMYGLRPN